MDRSIAQVVEGFRDLAHIPSMARLFAVLFTDRRVPLWLKICAGAGAVYVISPLDIIPDSVTGIGYLDDIILVVLLLQTFIEMSPDDVVFEHCERLGIDPHHLHVDITQAVTSSIAAVLPFLEKGGANGKPASEGSSAPPSASAARYSAYDEDGDDEEAASSISSSAVHPLGEAPAPAGMKRYSAYSTPHKG